MGRALKNGPGLEPIHELQASNLLHETLRISSPFPIVGLGPFFKGRALSLPNKHGPRAGPRPGPRPGPITNTYICTICNAEADGYANFWLNFKAVFNFLT